MMDKQGKRLVKDLLTVVERPIHESIVEAIKRAQTGNHLSALASLIKETKIPAGHDAIIAAWEERTLGYTRDELDGTEDGYLGVKAILLDKKARAEAEAQAKAAMASNERKVELLFQTIHLSVSGHPKSGPEISRSFDRARQIYSAQTAAELERAAKMPDG